MSDPHQQRHKELHDCLDELAADWISQTEARPSTSTVFELMKWSHQQTINPTGEFNDQDKL